jgi:hypothetical protein
MGSQSRRRLSGAGRGASVSEAAMTVTGCDQRHETCCYALLDKCYITQQAAKALLVPRVVGLAPPAAVELAVSLSAIAVSLPCAI